MQNLTEKRLYAVSEQLLLSDGTNLGEITIENASAFTVGQIVILRSNTQDITSLQVKRILKSGKIYLGLASKPIQDRSNLSSFTVADAATISAIEQKRPGIPEQEIERYTYEEEPVVARRVITVDEYGEKHSFSNPAPVSISDGDNVLDINPDGSINVVFSETSPIPKKINTLYYEIENIPKNIKTLVGNFTPSNASKKYFLQRVTIGGSNFADFTLELNSNTIMRKRTWAGGELFSTFEFDGYSDNGKQILITDTIELYIEHSRPFNGDFEVTFQVLEIG